MIRSSVSKIRRLVDPPSCNRKPCLVFAIFTIKLSLFILINPHTAHFGLCKNIKLIYVKVSFASLDSDQSTLTTASTTRPITIKPKVETLSKSAENSLSDNNNNTIASSQNDFYNSVQTDDDTRKEPINTATSTTTATSIIKKDSQNTSNPSTQVEILKNAKNEDVVDQTKPTSFQLLTTR
jgi:hypothetical protein